jgi:hypothetical protein
MPGNGPAKADLKGLGLQRSGQRTGGSGRQVGGNKYGNVQFVEEDHFGHRFSFLEE